MYNYGMAYNASSQGWTIASVILAIIGGIAVYFTFLKKSNDGKFKGFWGWMYDFLSFKKMMVEDILRVCYLICALLVTLLSFNLIGINFLEFIIMLIVGNIVVRMIYELTLVMLIICRNTTAINGKLGKQATPKATPKADEAKTDEAKTDETKADEAKTE